MFFATDLHGSDTCFRKFVAAAGFYRADTLILGGDLSGKLLVPVVAAGGGRWTAELHGDRRELRTGGLEEFERQARAAGLYTRRMDPDEHAEYAVEGEIVEIAPGHEMASTGYTNLTPWHTHREYSEEEIADRLRSLTDRLSSPHTAISNLHVPPYNSGLDSAPLLGQDLKIKTGVGGLQTAPVGSTAVRAAIEEHQPLLSLHGHIHESGRTVHIGRTTVINAGSEYGEGILRGVLLTVGGGRLLRYQTVSVVCPAFSGQ